MNEERIVIDDSWYKRPATARVRISAGGIVLRQEAQRTFIALAREADLSMFVLPKGGVEPGETLEAAARREILEEVGIAHLHLIGNLKVLERLSYNKGAWLQVHYFLFTTTQKEGVPTDTASHYALWWFPIDALPPLFWPEQQRLIETYLGIFETVFTDPQRVVQQLTS